MRAMTLASSESDADRRIAYLILDDAVELMLRTYVELPSQFTDVDVTQRRALESASFEGLLDAVRTFAAPKLLGLDLREIEFLHQARRRLYHEGSGIELAADRLEVYLALAQLLFRRLFHEDMGLRPPGGPGPGTLFIERWAELEDASFALATSLEEGAPPPLTLGQLTRGLVRVGVMSTAALAECETLRTLRHRFVHVSGTSIEPDAVTRLESLSAELLGRR